MEINPSNLSALFIGFDQRFQALFKEAPSILEKVANVIPSNTTTLALPWLQLFPQMREWLGDRVVNNYVLQDIQIVNKLYELTAEIERTKIEDDQYGAFLAMAPARLARQTKQKPDRELATAIEANGTGFDGVAFFSGSHPQDPTNPASATQSNLFDSGHGGVAMPLTPTNVATVRAAMMNMKGPDGATLGLIPNALMVPPAWELAARQAANSQFYPTSISGSAGPVSNVFAGAYDVIVNPYLTDALSWYLLCTNEGTMPFIWSERTAPEYVTVTDPANPIVFMKDKFMIGVRRRGAAALGLYYLAAKATNS